MNLAGVMLRVVSRAPNVGSETNIFFLGGGIGGGGGKESQRKKKDSHFFVHN
jgi:hypothetical protein